VPRVVERIPAAERAGMFGNDPPVLTDHDAVRIGLNFDGTPDCGMPALQLHGLASRRRCQV
jgi:hypothetical protein